MLLHRQKILLALLDALGGEVGATDFQKYLFLFTQICEQDKSYDFVPYKFGCYSFQSMADKHKLEDKGYLSTNNQWELARNSVAYAHSLKPGEADKIKLFVNKYGGMKGKRLIKHVYRNYPYYAIRSEIAESHLTSEELDEVIKHRPTRRRKAVLATIGYEGGSVENYINTLLKNDIRVLIDVRKNPLSRKYGFSKKTLSMLLERVGIDYRHIPALGIESADRKDLDTQADYNRLFARYEKTVLKTETAAMQKILEMYDQERRVALTCFEKEHQQCHRSPLASKLVKLAPTSIDLQHL